MHLPGEQPCKDLGHHDLLELFGHDEEQGLSTILLEQGTEIEIPIEDEQGVPSDILDRGQSIILSCGVPELQGRVPRQCNRRGNLETDTEQS